MDFFTDIGVAIIESLRTMLGYLAAIIFDFIVILYDLFMYLSRVEILDSDFIQSIYSKVGSILVLFMVFKLTFTLINSLINPEKFNDKKKGFTAIIVRCVFSIVMLGITPFIFKELFVFQRLIIGADNSGDNVLYKLVLSDSIVSDSTSFGKTLASNLFFGFYTDDERPKLGVGTIEKPNGEWVNEDIDSIRETIETDSDGSFFYAIKYLTLKNNTGEYYIEYNVIFPIIIGIFIAWILVMYCIQTAVRVFQLAYLQLIAPVPILSYISDPEGSFKKWISQCINTYLDLFIRLLIIYFVLYLCDYITKNIDDIIKFDLGLYNASNGMYVWIYIFLIIGLFVFAKRVPDLIKDLFPSKGGAGKFSFGLNPKKELNNTLAAGFIGGAVGAVGAGASNAVHGFMNTKKAFKDNGGWRNIKAYGAAAVAGGKGILSVAGGTFGGAKSGLKTKDITKTTDAIKIANANREKRELKAAAGYHWYRPDKVISDKVMSFAGETTGAEKKIKDAEKQLKSIELARNAMWKKAEDDVKNGLLSAEKYSFIRGLERTTDNRGRVFYSGFDSRGNTVNIAEANLATDVRTSGYEFNITENARFDKQAKTQNKIIKGLQTANNDAKKK